MRKTKSAIFNLVGTVVNHKTINPIQSVVNIMYSLKMDNYLIGVINENDNDGEETELIMDTIRYLPVDAYTYNCNGSENMIKDLLSRWKSEYKTDYIQLSYVFCSNANEIYVAKQCKSKYVMSVNNFTS